LFILTKSFAAPFVVAAVAAVAAAELREAAFGGEAVVKSDIAVYQENLAYRVCDGFAAERSLAGSTAATVLRCYGIAVGSSVWGRSWTPR
jgi:hypothetical protein